MEVVPTPDQVLETLRSLAGVAAFVAAFVGLLMWRGIVTPETAPNVAFALNTAAYVGIVILFLVNRIDLLPLVDKTAGAIAQIIQAIIMIFVLQGGAQIFFKAIRGVKFIGPTSEPHAFR